MFVELSPRFDNRSSFYRKATIEIDNDKMILYSYNTPVCMINNGTVTFNSEVQRDLLFSNTTLRHIKEFLKQNNFKAETRQQIESDYSFSKIE